MATSVQTSYPTSYTAGIAGQLADSGDRFIKSVIAETEIAAGLPVLRGGTTKAEGRAPFAPATADVDAIVETPTATATTAQTLSGAGLDGSAVGQGEMFPPRPVTLTLNSHADWNLTTAKITGTDEDGNVIVEDVVIPDAGNTTVTTQRAFRTVTSVYIPGQGGTNGSFTVGFGAALGPIGPQTVHGVAMYDASREPEAYPLDYAVPCVRRGRVFMTSETSYTDMDPVYVRFVISGDEVRGHVRNSPDSTDCALFKGARFVGTGSAGAAVVELNLP